jgi:transposase
MFDILPQTLYHWYRNYLSDYSRDKLSCNWPSKSLEKVDVNTGEMTMSKPVYVFEPKNIGERMSIDDKVICGNTYTIMSNNDTGLIAMLVESVQIEELWQIMLFFGSHRYKVRSISCDMSPTYLSLCHDCFPYSQVVVDKFHVMKYVYDAVSDVRLRLKKTLTEQLSKEKTKTQSDKIILSNLEMIRRNRYRLLQSPDKWSQRGYESITTLFSLYPELKIAYHLSQQFKHWYDISQQRWKMRSEINRELEQWYNEVKNNNIKEFDATIKMIRKHEDEILNYFSCGHTNAKAERLNGKIQRFLSANYGTKDKDFFMYRIKGYFS